MLAFDDGGFGIGGGVDDGGKKQKISVTFDKNKKEPPKKEIRSWSWLGAFSTFF